MVLRVFCFCSSGGLVKNAWIQVIRQPAALGNASDALRLSEIDLLLQIRDPDFDWLLHNFWLTLQRNSCIVDEVVVQLVRPITPVKGLLASEVIVDLVEGYGPIVG